jgi:hypothetical protein
MAARFVTGSTQPIPTRDRKLPFQHGFSQGNKIWLRPLTYKTWCGISRLQLIPTSSSLDNHLATGLWTQLSPNKASYRASIWGIQVGPKDASIDPEPANEQDLTIIRASSREKSFGPARADDLCRPKLNHQSITSRAFSLLHDQDVCQLTKCMTIIPKSTVHKTMCNEPRGAISN